MTARMTGPKSATHGAHQTMLHIETMVTENFRILHKKSQVFVKDARRVPPPSKRGDRCGAVLTAGCNITPVLWELGFRRRQGGERGNTGKASTHACDAALVFAAAAMIALHQRGPSAHRLRTFRHVTGSRAARECSFLPGWFHAHPHPAIGLLRSPIPQVGEGEERRLLSLSHFLALSHLWGWAAKQTDGARSAG